eukprot:SAG11_NODE_23009_length_396_cov_1.468013_1_plen_100_part_01
MELLRNYGKKQDSAADYRKVNGILRCHYPDTGSVETLQLRCAGSPYQVRVLGLNLVPVPKKEKRKKKQQQAGHNDHHAPALSHRPADAFSGRRACIAPPR